MANQGTGKKIVAKNRKARHDYELLDHFEAGLVLQGSEIKSIRANQVNLRIAYVQMRDGELWLVDAHIAQYAQASINNHEPTRARKLLLNKREIRKIKDALKQKGLSLVPTILYLTGGRAKVEVALARGKKRFDKRQDIAKKDADRRMEREVNARF